jgi:hypothetical protein
MSRYAYCWNKTLSTGELRKLPRGFFYFQKFSDTVEHICTEGETLFNLAAMYYREAFPYANLMYWAIADFQPIPIIDATVVFKAGQVVYIPSIQTINLQIMNPTREPEFESW